MFINLFSFDLLTRIGIDQFSTSLLVCSKTLFEPKSVEGDLTYFNMQFPLVVAFLAFIKGWLDHCGCGSARPHCEILMMYYTEAIWGTDVKGAIQIEVGICF